MVMFVARTESINATMPLNVFFTHGKCRYTAEYFMAGVYVSVATVWYGMVWYIPDFNVPLDTV